MRNENKNEAHRMERNRLVLAIFISLCLGFIAALYLGALPDTEKSVSDEWIAIAVSIGAAAISGYAVFLVNETLKETRNMVLDQANTNAAETAPWLFVESIDISPPAMRDDMGKSFFSATITVRNSGKTPAMYVRIKAKQKTQSHPFDRIISAPIEDEYEINHIGPNATYVETIKGIELSVINGVKNTIITRLSYHRILDFRKEEAPLQVSKTPHMATIVHYLDFYNGKYVVRDAKVRDFKQR